VKKIVFFSAQFRHKDVIGLVRRFEHGPLKRRFEMSNAAPLADQYGALKSQIEALTLQLKEVHKEIVATGTDRIVGQDFLVLVSLRKNTELSEDKVMKTFGVTLAEFKKMSDACKVEKEPSVVVNYEARF